jgi:hypothetical protein
VASFEVISFEINGVAATQANVQTDTRLGALNLNLLLITANDLAREYRHS